MKLFQTSNIDVVKICQQYFNYEMPSTLWSKRSASFDNKFSSSENVFCKITQYLIYTRYHSNDNVSVIIVCN